MNRVSASAVFVASLLGGPTWASAAWSSATLTSGKQGDVGVFGATSLSIDGSSVVVANGSFGPFGFRLGSDLSWTRDAPSVPLSSPVEHIAISGRSVFVSAGMYLYRYTRESTGVWSASPVQAWPVTGEITGLDADGSVAVATCRTPGPFTYSNFATVFENRGAFWDRVTSFTLSGGTYACPVRVMDLPNEPGRLSLGNARVIVGDPNMSTAASYAGGAWILEQTAGVWSAQTLPLAAPISGDRVGISVALNQDLAFVGDQGAPGVVHVFERGLSGWGMVWFERSSIVPDLFDADVGLSLDADDQRVVVGTSGAAWVCTLSPKGVWECQSLTPGAGSADFGITLGIDGGTLIVGGGQATSTTGAVHVFRAD